MLPVRPTAILTAELWVGLYRSMPEIVSCYQYLETRFDGNMRSIVSCIGNLSTFFYISIVRWLSCYAATTMSCKFKSSKLCHRQHRYSTAQHWPYPRWCRSSESSPQSLSSGASPHFTVRHQLDQQLALSCCRIVHALCS